MVNGYGEGGGPVLAFDFGNDKFAMIGAEDGCCLADTGRANVFGNGFAGIGNINGSQFFSRKKDNFFVVFVLKHRTEFLVFFHVDGAISVGTGQDAALGKGFVYLVVDAFVVFRMMSQTKANGSYHRHEMQFEHSLWRMADIGRHDDEQLVFARVGLADVMDDGDVVGLRRH